MLPHLGAAYNLAVWLLRHPQDAEDVVQDAYLKAYKAFDQFEGEYPNAWLLKIVRNTCLTFLGRKADKGKIVSLDAALDGAEASRILPFLHDKEPLPDATLSLKQEQALVYGAISQLPVEYREIIILREFEDLTYQQIAKITEIPIGTVMSRISRARRKLRELLRPEIIGGQRNEL
ncbi:MAG: sigma-70 family RNA polymerase sigma factor [Rhodospirillales bacterium]|nr:sigma-70 family RNA polymerase sigma factor [Rhodospirillales bacterium]